MSPFQKASEESVLPVHKTQIFLMVHLDLEFVHFRADIDFLFFHNEFWAEVSRLYLKPQGHL
ncbi:hypothetical protein DV872_12955 [Oceanispirochaeta sp. M1]|nr:hypothetical protein DV872_12955 [Oceanispirochaeta sp. M1]